MEKNESFHTPTPRHFGSLLLSINDQFPDCFSSVIKYWNEKLMKF